jgi:hypothetical protein
MWAEPANLQKKQCSFGYWEALEKKGLLHCLIFKG